MMAPGHPHGMDGPGPCLRMDHVFTCAIHVPWMWVRTHVDGTHVPWMWYLWHAWMAHVFPSMWPDSSVGRA